MNAEQVRAYVQARFPGVLESPLAQAMHGASALAILEASNADTVVERAEALAAGRAAAERCLAACDGWTVETLSVQIESAAEGALDWCECDELARELLKGDR